MGSATHKASINALSEETGVDRRTVKKRLSGLKSKRTDRGLLFNKEKAIQAIQSGSNRKTADIIESEARKLTAQAQREEIKALREARKVAEVAFIDRAWEGITNLAKKRLLLIPTKFESQWRPDLTQQQARKIIETEIDESLSELAKEIEYFSPEEIAEGASQVVGATSEAED